MCNQSPDAEHMCRGAEARGRRAGGGGTFDLLGWVWGAKPQWPEFEQVFIHLFLLAQSWPFYRIHPLSTQRGLVQKVQPGPKTSLVQRWSKNPGKLS